MNSENYLEKFDKIFNRKKILNIVISSIIVTGGIFAIFYMFSLENTGILALRWMTVDGTIYTTVLTCCCLFINIYEIKRKTEISRRVIYFIRLSCAVAECLILAVVMISQLPVFETHLHLIRPDMFFMHVLIPILAIYSFTFNDTPIGKLKLKNLIAGTAYVLLYAAIIVTLILTGVIHGKYIPYFFLDVYNLPIYITIISYVTIFAMALLFSALLYKINRKLYWKWYEGIFKRK
ncbi:MAG: hypothetical protein E7242_10405 [Lachnospiraceae bacterium]|nr:hypothetical protein [Lachnospiraceae bacterium]